MLDERSLYDVAMEALWGVEEWMGTEAEGNGWIDDQNGSRHGKFGAKDPTDGMFKPDMSVPDSDKDKDDFNIDKNGIPGKAFVEGNIWKDKKGDTSTYMERDGTNTIQTYKDKDAKTKEALKKWTPVKEKK